MSKATLSDNVGIITVGTFIAQFMGLISGIILIRILTPAAAGTYEQLFLLHGLLGTLLGLALPTSILYFLPRLEPAEHKGFISQSVLILAGSGLLMQVCMVFGAPLISRYFQNPALRELLPIFSFYPLFEALHGFFNGYLIVTGRVRMVAVYSIIVSLASSLALLVPLFLGAPLSVIVALIVIVPGCKALFALLYARAKLGGYDFRVSWPSIRQQLRYAVPLGLTATIGTLAYQIDQLIVGGILGPDAYAAYAYGAKEVPFIALISAAVNNILIPEISRYGKDKNYPAVFLLWRNAIRKTSLLLLPAFVVLLLFSEQFIVGLYSAKYVDSVAYFRIYLLLMPLRVATYGLIVQALGLTRYNLLGALWFLTSNTVLAAALTLLIGPAGAALATVLATFGVAGYYLIVMRRHFGFAISMMFPWRAVGRIFGLAAAAGALIWPLRWLPLPPLVSLLVAGAVYSAIYIVLLAATSSLLAEDWRLLQRWVSRLWPARWQPAWLRRWWGRAGAATVE